MKNTALSDTVRARIIKKANAKEARAWEVTDPISHLPFADQVSSLCELFASGRLGAKQPIAIEAVAHALTLMMNDDTHRSV